MSEARDAVDGFARPDRDGEAQDRDGENVHYARDKVAAGPCDGAESVFAEEIGRAT